MRLPVHQVRGLTPHAQAHLTAYSLCFAALRLPAAGAAPCSVLRGVAERPIGPLAQEARAYGQSAICSCPTSHVHWAGFSPHAPSTHLCHMANRAAHGLSNGGWQPG